MEKISRILPQSRRMQANIDTSNSQPVRPGAPTFGRPMGRSRTAEVNKAAELADLDARLGLQLPAEDLSSIKSDDIEDKIELSEKLADVDVEKEKSPKNYQGVKPVEVSKVEDLAKRFFNTKPKVDIAEDVVVKTPVIDAAAID